ncbi:hypothetical protein C8F04DRAFT_1143742 [Mycena alexandri]|uniref:Uncharacterized protein n=1 Tax=Mycena alexandri TaxID=1745969 RepID=A0AAD6S3T8_9AGAR|nr:hypothetical protein C8F04DRAFT_1143742 [Mycena alexandri]
MRSFGPLAALRPPRASFAPSHTAACGARPLHRVPKGAWDGPACAGQVELRRAPPSFQVRRVCSISAHVEGAECARMCNLSSSFSRAFASRPLIYPPASLVPVVSSPSCRGRVCALPAHADDGAERMCGGSWAPAEFACARSVLGGHDCVASRPAPTPPTRAVPAPSRVPPPHTSRRCRIPIQPLWGFCLMRTNAHRLESNMRYNELHTYFD